MEAKKQTTSKRTKSYKKKQEPDKSDLKAKLHNLSDKLGQLESRAFWRTHLKWPKFIRKPRIRFSMPRLSGTLPIPNRTIMFVIALFLVGFSIAGGAYDMVSKTTGKIAIGYDTNSHPPRPIFFINGMNDQFMLEGIIAFTIILCGFLGFIFIHQSTKHFYRPKYSYILFTVGIGLLLFAFISMTSIALNGKNLNMYSQRW
ncbi:MAG: hypothetical protein ACTSQI_01230 [Candidatus Helarchaeota archaeon]